MKNQKTKRTLLSLLAALVVLGGGWFGLNGMRDEPVETTAAPAQTAEAEDVSAAPETEAADPTAEAAQTQRTEETTAAQEIRYVFYNEKTMREHFAKHKDDTGCASVEEYLARANAVIGNPDSLHKLEAEDGDDIYYLEATNEIVFVSQRGYIRTYFRPDRGLAYFNKQ